MYKPVINNLTKLIKEPKRKRQLAKKEKIDIKIIQDFQLAQIIAKEAISKHSDANVVINIFNRQTSNVYEPTDKQEKVEIEKITDASIIEIEEPVVIPEKLKNSDSLQRNLTEIMKELPPRRHHNLIMMMYKVAYENCSSIKEMAEWLGVGRSSIYDWYKKMGVPSLYKARKGDK